MADKTPLFSPEHDEKKDKTVSTGEADALFNRVYGDDVKKGINDASGVVNAEKNGTIGKKGPNEIPKVNLSPQLSPKKPGIAGLVDSLRNLKGAKEKGPVALITALIVVIISIIGVVGSTSLLGQSISGNILDKFNSGMSMFEKANNNLVTSRLFGTKQTCSAGKKLICDAIGVTPEQLSQLEKNGVKVNPAGGIPDQTGERVFFDSVEVNGEVIDHTNIDEKLKNTKIKRALLPITKPTSWAAQKNYQRQKVKRALGISENPDTSAKDKKQLAEKVYDQTHEKVGDISTDGKVSTPEQDTSDPDSGTRATNVDIDTGTNGIAEEAARLEARALAGQLSNNTLPNGDVLSAIGQDPIQADNAEAFLKQGWSWLNSVDVLDAACTAYQIGNAAAAIARTISMVNTVRYGYMFLSAWDKVKAGDATQADITELMNTVTALNKYGESFDSSVGMQYIFTGKLTTSTPPTISTVGGQTLQTMASSLTEFNRFFDVVGGQSSALRGYQTVKVACGLATNLAFQIGATIVDWGVTLISTPFTGGATLAANISGKAAIKTAFTAGKEVLIKTFKTKVVDLFSKSVTKEVRRDARKEALRDLRRQATDPIQAVMIGLTLVENFGLSYIAQSLAGTDVIAYLNDSVQTGDAIVAAAAYTDTASVIASGGVIQSIPQYQVAMDENKQATSSDIALQKSIADPLDINNRYSTLGSFMMAFAGQIGGINTSSFLSSARGILNIPLSSLSKISSPVGAVGDEVTAQSLSDFVNNPVLQELNVSNDAMGNPGVAGNAAYLAKTDPMQLLNDAIDQGFITSDGHIIAGSSYGKHVEDCNNPNKMQVDPTLFGDDQLQPTYCRDGSDINNRFNAITTYRSLMVNEATNTADGTKAEIAQRIVDKGNVRYWSGNGGVHPTVDEVANGSNNGNSLPCGLNIYILKIIDAITDKYPMMITDLNRYCEKFIPGGVSIPDGSSESSLHYKGNGSAIDIDSVNGIETNGRDAMSMEIIDLIMPILVEAASVGGPGSVVGQSNCGATPKLGPGVTQIVDKCNHLHISVPANADPGLEQL